MLLRDELQNMHGGQPVAEPEPAQDMSQVDPEIINNMMLHYVNMQSMMSGSHMSWDMSPSENSPYHSNYSYERNHQNPYFMFQPIPNMTHGEGFSMNRIEEGQFPPNRNSGNSQQVEQEDDNWSTRPRARAHISKGDLALIPENSRAQPKIQPNFEHNILRSVEGLLEDDPNTENLENSYKDSNFLSVMKTHTRSVENSGFGSAKYNSGWSDTAASRMNKTRGSDGRSVQSKDCFVSKSFGESKIQDMKLTSDLSTIFESKEGLFFPWQSGFQSILNTDNTNEAGFNRGNLKMASELRGGYSLGVNLDESNEDIMPRSHLDTQSKPESRFRPTSNEHQEDEYTSTKKQ